MLTNIPRKMEEVLVMVSRSVVYTCTYGVCGVKEASKCALTSSAVCVSEGRDGAEVRGEGREWATELWVKV